VCASGQSLRKSIWNSFGLTATRLYWGPKGSLTGAQPLTNPVKSSSPATTSAWTTTKTRKPLRKIKSKNPTGFGTARGMWADETTKGAFGLLDVSTMRFDAMAHCSVQ
jgi:hypothetical protein